MKKPTSSFTLGLVGSLTKFEHWKSGIECRSVVGDLLSFSASIMKRNIFSKTD